MSYGSFESILSVELEDGRETEFQLIFNCVTLGCSARLYGPPEDCWPAETAEFELDSIHVLDDEGKPVKISETILAAFIGTVRAEEMIEDAEVEAMESGGF